MPKKKDNTKLIIGIVIAVAVFLILFSGGFSGKAKCEKENGVWGAGGLNPEPFCNHRTTDFGLRCDDISQCEGTCLSNPIQCFTQPCLQGQCSEFEMMFGCRDELIGGSVQTLCRD